MQSSMLSLPIFVRRVLSLDKEVLATAKRVIN